MKAIVFDMDGTLLDSMPGWNAVNAQLIEEFDIPMAEVDYDVIITQGFEDLVRMLKENFDFETDVNVLYKRANSIMSRWYKEHSVTREGVLKTLNCFKEAGIPMGVATATSYELAVPALEKAGILEYFDLVYSSSTDGLPKNDKRYWEAVAKAMGQAPEDMALFDDALYALITAKAAGYTVVALEDEAYGQDIDQMKRRADDYLVGFEHFNPSEWLKKEDTRRVQ